MVILTNSVDGTADVLVEMASERGNQVFRFNVDLWSSYTWKIAPELISFSDPTGFWYEIDPTSVVIYRKPFIDLVSSENKNIEPVLKGQVRGLVLYLIAFARKHLNLRVVEPFADRRLPKLSQLNDAVHYFAVPDWSFTNQSKAPDWDCAITKPLTTSQLGNGNIFFTARFVPGSLETDFPWFVQKEITNSRDVTCVYISGKVWFYACLVNREISGVDWRTTINSDSEADWILLTGEIWDKHSQSVCSLMEGWGLFYGRLDFMLDSLGKLWFLECNSNGQFGWLDNSELEMHSEFLSACFDKSNSVEAT